MIPGLPGWGDTAKGVKIVDGAGNPLGLTSDAPLSVETSDWQDFQDAALSRALLWNSNKTPVAVKRVSISATTNGDNQLIAAVAARQLIIVGLYMTLSADTTVRFESNTSGNFLTGVMNIYATPTGIISGASGIIDWSAFNPVGYLETVAGESLNLILSGGDAFGWLTYFEY